MNPILFRIKNKSQKLLFSIAGVDDCGVKLHSPMGVPMKGAMLGDILIDPEGNYFLIQRIGIRLNEVWVEKITKDKDSAA